MFLPKLCEFGGRPLRWWLALPRPLTQRHATPRHRASRVIVLGPRGPRGRNENPSRRLAGDLNARGLPGRTALGTALGTALHGHQQLCPARLRLFPCPAFWRHCAQPLAPHVVQQLELEFLTRCASCPRPFLALLNKPGRPPTRGGVPLRRGDGCTTKTHRPVRRLQRHTGQRGGHSAATAGQDSAERGLAAPPTV